jgi:16S rRNA G966 N2-methylase RsmD
MEELQLEELRGDPANPRILSKHDGEALDRSLKEFGDLSGIVFNRRTGMLVGGHQRVEILKRMMGDKKVIVTSRFEQPDKVGTTALGYVLYDGKQFAYREVDWDKEWQHAANIAANRISGEFNLEMLAQINYELSQLENGEELLRLTGQTTDEINKLLADIGVGEPEEPKGNLADDFIAPPFSVLDTKQGYWQSRKRAWLEIGIKSEEGRDDIGSISDSAQNGLNKMAGTDFAGGTSVFDPVLTEIAYKWFNIPGGVILDPFAGGSVRGVVASRTGYPYLGLELRGEQVVANQKQAAEICDTPLPIWQTGDSNVTLDTLGAGTFDLVFSCPPYADLEVYSKDPADISNMPYEQFLQVYRSIIAKAASKLRQDRFAVWVIGEVRAKNGIYYNFVGDTIKAFQDAGMQYYNEIILVNTAGTLPLRAGRQFSVGRKVGKQHQNVLVFYKGDPRNIKQTFGEIDFSALETEEAQDGQPEQPPIG